MLLSTPLHMLLLGYLLSFSACCEGVTKLSDEEISTYSTSRNLTNTANVVTGELLTGYYLDIQYTDATCSNIRYAESYALNVCNPWIDGSSYQVFANSTHTATYTYSTISCTTLSGGFIESNALRVCGQNYKTFSVTHSYPTITSSAPLLSAV